MILNQSAMRLLKLSAALSTLSHVRPTMIIPPQKLCKDCKHFRPNMRECSLFGDVDMVHGKHSYTYASTARLSETKCGKDAKMFVENSAKILTVPYYFMKDYWLPVFVFGMYGTLFVNMALWSSQQ